MKRSEIPASDVAETKNAGITLRFIPAYRAHFL